MGRSIEFYEGELQHFWNQRSVDTDTRVRGQPCPPLSADTDADTDILKIVIADTDADTGTVFFVTADMDADTTIFYSKKYFLIETKVLMSLQLCQVDIFG